MDESTLRHQVCEAGRQLWMRRVISGDGGMVTAELHRRRYLATPIGRRRADLTPEDLMCVDLGGVNILGGGEIINNGAWHPHRLAYQGAMQMEHAGPGGRRSIHATVVATPPNVMALYTLSPGAESIDIINLRPLPIVRSQDDPQVQQMILANMVVLLPGHGVFAAGHDLPQCLNTIETLEHHASIELATRGYREG